MLYKITIFLFSLIILSSCALAVSSNLTLGEQVTLVTTCKGAFVLECYPNDILVAGDRFIELIKQKSYGGFTFHQMDIGCPLVNAAVINDIHLFGWLDNVISWIVDALKKLDDIPDEIIKVLKGIKKVIDWMLRVLIEPDGVLENILQVISWGFLLFFGLRWIGRLIKRFGW